MSHVLVPNTPDLGVTFLQWELSNAEFGQKLLQFKTARGAPITQKINPYCRIHKRSRAAAVTAHEKDKINS